jgi:hypothetical protein
MKKSLTILSLFIFLYSNFVLSQKDIIADQKPFGLIFLDGQKYPDCRMCNLEGEEKKQFDNVTQKIENLSPSERVFLLEDFLTKDYSGNVKARIAMTIAQIKFWGVISTSEMDYNIEWSDYDYSGLSDKEINGALEIINCFGRAIEFAEDEGSQSHLKKGRQGYIVHSGLYDEILDQNELYNISLDDNINELKNKPDQKRILEYLNNDYAETGYIPFNQYWGINTGLIYSLGKHTWIGGELGLDYCGTKKLFRRRNYFGNLVRNRASAMSISFQHNLNTGVNDFSFDLIKLRELAPWMHLNLNITQFGFHQGLPGVDGVKWFYRPEIGFAYGPFSVIYAYNLTFNKGTRYLTEKNMFVAKLSYPLVRISRYE